MGRGEEGVSEEVKDMNALRILLGAAAMTVLSVWLFVHIADHRTIGPFFLSSSFNSFAVLFVVGAFLIVVSAKKRNG